MLTFISQSIVTGKPCPKCGGTKFLPHLTPVVEARQSERTTFHRFRYGHEPTAITLAAFNHQENVRTALQCVNKDCGHVVRLF